MTARINRTVEGLEGRFAPGLRVTCATCHRGRTDPRPLPHLLAEAYEVGGADSAATVYRSLRAATLGSGAYDFRPAVLQELAASVAARGALDDALALSRLNEVFHPGDGAVRRGTLTLELGGELEGGGVAGVLRRFGEALSAENLEAFPGAYIAHESLAESLVRSGRRDEGLAVLEAWTRTHPDDETARRVLLNLRALGG